MILHSDNDNRKLFGVDVVFDVFCQHDARMICDVDEMMLCGGMLLSVTGLTFLRATFLFYFPRNLKSSQICMTASDSHRFAHWDAPYKIEILRYELETLNQLVHL